MACFCTAGIAPFCQLPRLPPRRQCPLSFFCKLPRLAHRRATRYQKLTNPPLPLFARSANCTRFFAPCIFSAQISRLAKLHSFSHFSFVCKKQHFFAYRNFKGVFGFLFSRPFFKNRSFFCAYQKSDPILTTQKEGGFFILSHQNSTLN